MSGIKCVDHLGNIFSSKTAMASYYGISNRRLHARLKAGFSLEDALTKPLVNYSVCDHLGHTYKSIEDMCTHYGITASLYKDRIHRGYSVEKALLTEKDALSTRVEFTDHLGNVFHSITECADYYNIPMKTLSYRLNHNWSIEKALITPVKIKRCKDHLGHEFTTAKDMCKYWNMSYELYCSRIRDGWSVEDALTKNKIYSTILSNDEFLKRLQNVFGDKYSPLEEYKGMNTNIDVKCNVCCKTWSVRPANLFSGYGCPHCKESNYEKTVREYLNQNAISFSTQFVFPDCLSSGGNPSRFDFSIPDIGVIEVDGEGHFRQTSNWNFQRAVENDNLKTAYCENNHIPLLRIRYDQIQDGTYVNLIEDFINNPAVYIMKHNKYLSEVDYYSERTEIF